MLDALIQLALFTTKSLILVILLLGLLAGILALLSKGKDKIQACISIKNLSQKYRDQQETLLAEMLPKSEFKKFRKQQAEELKAKKDTPSAPRVFVLNFNGDIKASAVAGLREEVTAILNVAKMQDEVVVRLESGGGVVHGYGLAAAQLARLRDRQIPLTVAVDKVAASGGYMMASVANRIIAAPFAIIGSIGVLVQLPNFNRFLKDKHIDFEQLMAGDFKRTLTMFGHNTDEGRHKLQTDIEEIHTIFKASIVQYRPQIDIDKVATGEHWLATQAFGLKLVDEIKTSDDYLLTRSKSADIYELCFQTKKSWSSKLFAAANIFKRDRFASLMFQ